MRKVRVDATEKPACGGWRFRMADRCVAMVLEAPGKSLVPRDLPIPELGPGQILVRITAAGICGSDVHMWEGKDPRTPCPIILGHEGVGEIAAVSGDRTSVEGVGLRAGQAILWNRSVVCGTCYWCVRAHQPGLCPHRWVYGIHRSLHQPTYLNGCYSQYLVLDAGTDVFVLEDADTDPAALVAASCSGATAAHGIDLCPPKAGDVVVVQGPGPLGIFVVAFARERGARAIVVIGGTQQRLDLCSVFGATTLLNRRTTTEQERAEVVLELTEGRGADLVVEAVGAAEAYREGLSLVRRGGAYMSMGVATPVDSVKLDPYRDLVFKHLRLQGVWVSHTKHTAMALRLIRKHRADFGRLVTHRFPLGEANEALEVTRVREGLKTVLVPERAEP